MCILGKLLEAETYWFGNLRAEMGELFTVFMSGNVKGILMEWFGGKVGEIFVVGRKRH